MAGIALQKPTIQKQPRDHRTFWALFCMALITLMAMIGLPLVNTYLATSMDLNGTWTCTSTCPKSNTFMLRGGGVYRENAGAIEQIGYWKWNPQTGLVMKAKSSNQKGFKWLFFSSSLEPKVNFRWWTGEPQFCVDSKRVWCFTRTSAS